MHGGDEAGIGFEERGRPQVAGHIRAPAFELRARGAVEHERPMLRARPVQRGREGTVGLIRPARSRLLG